MYQIAEENGVENLVAGAWGCGVFMQDPYTVATLLIGAARNYNIPNIYFAIPDRNSQNFRAFLKAGKEVVRERDGIMYHMDISLDTDLFHDWILKLFAARRIKMIYCERSKQLKSLVWRSIKITF